MPQQHPLKLWLLEPGTSRSQSALADEVGVTQSFISKLASGERNCDPLLAEKLSKATAGAVSVEDLIFFSRRRRRRTRNRAA